ncbi:MAG: carbamate kinase [Actinomycetota bacterium]|nr:carbamate kinase [Actinomycetota bacterium]
MVASEPDHPPIAVVALGGNALQSPSGDDSVEADFERTRQTAEHLAALVVSAGWRLVVTHGNGPQVGNHLLRSELGREHGELPTLPLDVCVADTQGGMGYMLQQALSNAFHAAGVPAVVASLVTQVVVDEDDVAFSRPTKPVGEIIGDDKVLDLQARGWSLVEDRHRGGWRRVVASPDPREIVEGAAIKALVDEGTIVIAAGGGGIPVVHSDDGSLRGVAAVIDKDLASALLASDVGAERFVVLTDVEFAYRGFDTPDQSPLHELSVAEARELIEAGEFGDGSMRPKIEALCRFVEKTGRPALITSIDAVERALDGETGTRITP